MSDADYKKILTPAQYHVTREKGTERPFTSDLLNVKEAGVFKCVCCGEPLFVSDHKFDSGCGWPSFFKAKAPGALKETPDLAHG
jgi:peptide-methionine (R)-S-oxide reductase